MSRTRSEYRRSLDVTPAAPARRSGPPAIAPATSADRDALAGLLLDAYRGTIDDEGEGEAEARQAIDHYLGRLLPAYSVVIEEDGRPVAMSFVVVVGGRHFIDPVATAAERKGRGLGTEAVLHSLGSARRRRRRRRRRGHHGRQRRLGTAVPAPRLRPGRPLGLSAQAITAE